MAGLTGLIESDLIPLVAQYSPMIATALGTPAAGMVVSLIAHAFGCDGKDVKEITSAIHDDPEAGIKIKTLQFQHQDAIASLKTTDYANEVSDREDARHREIILHDHIPAILAIGFLIIYASVQLLSTYAPHGVDDIISARVQDIFVMIVSYYFGSMNRPVVRKSIN
jgi:hypothetical protein